MKKSILFSIELFIWFKNILMNDSLAKRIDLVLEFSSLSEFQCSVTFVNNLSLKFQSGSYQKTCNVVHSKL